MSRVSNGLIITKWWCAKRSADYQVFPVSWAIIYYQILRICGHVYTIPSQILSYLAIGKAPE